MIESLFTGSGVWGPLVWTGAFFFALTLVYWIRSHGESSYSEGTEQTKPYLSGQEAPTGEGLQVKSDNVYWGFLETFEPCLRRLRDFHSGIVNDYMGWFFVVMAVLLVVLTVT